MKGSGQDVVPEDYRKLQEEISELKKMLANERLHVDFYEEMVAYGKEVYGIDFKNWHQVVCRLHVRDRHCYGIVTQCRLLGVSKQSYYKHEDKVLGKLSEESFVVEFIREIGQKDPGISDNKL